MSPEGWNRCKNVVASLLDLERQEWPARLVEVCGDDVDVFLEASSLLAVSRAAEDFIHAPAWQLLAGCRPPSARAAVNGRHPG